METDPRPEHLEHLFKHRDVQDGNPRDNKNLPPSRGVGHIHRFQRSILPHTNSQSVQEVHALSPLGSVLPVQSPSLWPVHSSHGVHSGGQRGQTRGFSEGYKDPPVPRRLAGESLYPPHLSPAYSNPSHTLSGIRVAGEQGKVRAGSQTGLQLRRLPVRPERGQGQTNRRTLQGSRLRRPSILNTLYFRFGRKFRLSVHPLGRDFYEGYISALEANFGGRKRRYASNIYNTENKLYILKLNGFKRFPGKLFTSTIVKRDISYTSISTQNVMYRKKA